MKRLLRFRHHPSKNAGFTIVELIIAMAITSIMITLAGYGLTTMLRANQQSGSEISRRANLNRALDFMADEIRMARSMGSPQSADVPTSVNSCGSTTGVMTLQMPNGTRTVYYVHTITNSNCNSNLWARNATIRRRILTSTGTLVSDTLLVDGLMTPSATPTGCSPSPQTLNGSNGFYACLENSANARTATLFLYGRLTNAQGTVTGTYPVRGQVTARSF